MGFIRRHSGESEVPKNARDERKDTKDQRRNTRTNETISVQENKRWRDEQRKKGWPEDGA